ncbi:TetR/AcrR family transcriptional regulator [Actinomadura montaniterrae]|uniref:TetR/AcrR family transcriptional regulator n=1 Tax=Actinomadura montaniterrae TaxID=1803903 RepID=A0A6L3W1H1_9ACTN|nr:TetR/AcrR family transcriptional regulator [Actinomadura montaniterrae]KAB2388753.1 TetR/AcrR family transcriptional regulator [Actinomadura montaniterrae]
MSRDETAPTTRPEDSFSRPPRQSRSQQSFNKLLDAAFDLVSEAGSTAVTLADVVKRAGVSTGVVYARVKSKDDLLRALLTREISRLDEHSQQMLGSHISTGVNFEGYVARLLELLVEHLRSRAKALRVAIQIGYADPVAAEMGHAAYQKTEQRFVQRLLERRGDIRHPEPERAAARAFVIVYSVVGRHLGLHGERVTSPQWEWNELLEDLSTMIAHYLGRRPPA